MPRISFALSGLLLLLPCTLQAQDIQRFDQHYEGVLGTTLDLTFYGTDAAAMEPAAAAGIEEIKRLDAIFSNYRDDSEVMRLNRERSLAGASSEMMEILDLCGRWERGTKQRFSCKLGRIINIWNEAEKTQTLPDKAAMLELATATMAAEPTLDRGTKTITLPEPVELDLSGIATGYIIDHALAVVRKTLRGATAIKIDIGGDAIYWGRPPLSDGWRVAVANPMTQSDSDIIATLNIDGLAITESGHANRFRTIGGQQYSHIFVPTTGWPVENGIGVATIAPSGVTTEAAAKAMTQQGLQEAADWATAQPELDGMGVDAAGNKAVSDQWEAYVAEEIADESDSVLALNYTLPSFQSMGSYSRPYVAMWITDVKQNVVKNLLLLGDDQRWARENSRWWRQVGRDFPELIDGTARPTRAPGEYRLTWDGNDESGTALPGGDYTLHVEATRQNGGHDYQTLPFTLGTATALELPGKGELGELVLDVK
jgi:thiamine biosynthesis lipoprotein